MKSKLAAIAVAILAFVLSLIFVGGAGIAILGGAFAVLPIIVAGILGLAAYSIVRVLTAMIVFFRKR